MSQTCSKFVQLFICVLVLGGFLALPTPASARDEVTVSIHNKSHMRLHIYGAGLAEVAQIAPGKWTHITVPKKFRYQGSYHYTRQLMAVGGGSWSADRSGWTRYRNMKTCAVRTFKQKGGTFTWTLTGTAMKCDGPRGYHQ